MATIGTVTYPTATTWEAPVSGLAPGVSTFSVTDGTDTVAVSVTVPFSHRLRYGAAGRPPLFVSTGGNFAPVPLRISTGATYT